MGVPPTSAGDLVNPKITDCLPPGLDLLDPINPADPIQQHRDRLQRGADHLPHGRRGTNQNLITWTWPVSAKGVSGTLTLNTLVAPDAPPASLHNVTDLTVDRLPVALERTADVAVTSETLLRGTKFVKGDRDAAFIPGPGVGNTTRGGTAQYQATIRNVSDVAVTNVIVVDTLPIPGDIGLKDPAPRESGWEPFFAGAVHRQPAGRDGSVHDVAQPVPAGPQRQSAGLRHPELGPAARRPELGRGHPGRFRQRRGA